MERDERNRGEIMVEKLRILAGKREGNCTTPSPTWKFGLIQPDGTLIQEFDFSKNLNNLSARKLGANLWEMQRMSKNGRSSTYRKDEKEESVEAPAESPSEQPKSGRMGQHNVRAENIGEAQQPLSTASYCSSMEMAPHRRAITPNSSLSSKGRFRESSHSLKTSTELLKLLNRIWSLEEKHALDMSLVKMLKKELDQSQAQIKEILQDKKNDQNEIDSLKKQLTEHKAAKKKEQDQVKEELEKERKARVLLEDLCDEFAKGIRDYEQELHFVKHKSRKEGNDRLLLHISEAWLDERMQMKVENSRDVSKNQSVLDKLSFEIEAFLEAKKCDKIYYTPSRKSKHSLESLHLNGPASAPWNKKDEDDCDSAVSSRRSSQFSRGLAKSRTKKGKMMQKSMEGHFGHSSFAGPVSPVKKWRSEVFEGDPEISEVSLRWARSLERNDTLKAKLMEARLEGQKTRARTSKSSLQVD